MAIRWLANAAMAKRQDYEAKAENKPMPKSSGAVPEEEKNIRWFSLKKLASKNNLIKWSLAGKSWASVVQAYTAWRNKLRSAR